MPPKRQTVTLAQKKSNILQFFQQEHCVYNIKELEKLIPKKCNGVASILVKDLIHQMIDEDGIISVEKCGSTNIYWCFKNQIMSKMILEMDSLRARIQAARSDTLNVKATLQSNATDLRKETFETATGQISRVEKLAELDALERELNSLKSRYDLKSEHTWDQTKIEAKVKMLKVQVEKLNTVTDNIDLIIGYLSRRFMIDKKTLQTELNIPEEFMEFSDLPRTV